MPEETCEVHFELTGVLRWFSCVFSECNAYLLKDWLLRGIVFSACLHKCSLHICSRWKSLFWSLLAHCSFDIFPRTLLVFTSLMLKPGVKGNEAKSEVCFYRRKRPEEPPAVDVPGFV